MLKTNRLLWMLLLPLFAGCTTDRHIGGREFPLTITATSNNQPVMATAYIVPNDEWLHFGKDVSDYGACKKFLAPYEVTNGKTPVTAADVHPYQMVIIVEWKHKFTRVTTPVVPGEHPSVNVEVQ